MWHNKDNVDEVAGIKDIDDYGFKNIRIVFWFIMKDWGVNIW